MKRTNAPRASNSRAAYMPSSWTRARAIGLPSTRDTVRTTRVDVSGSDGAFASTAATRALASSLAEADSAFSVAAGSASSIVGGFTLGGAEPDESLDERSERGARSANEAIATPAQIARTEIESARCFVMLAARFGRTENSTRV